MPQEVTPEQFGELVENGVVLLDFFSPNCGPCRMLNPVLEQLENVTVLKIDAAQHPEFAAQYGVSAVPTLKFFKDAELKDTMIGLQSKDKLQSKIDELFGG